LVEASHGGLYILSGLTKKIDDFLIF
jgi:hypothetical protein